MSNSNSNATLKNLTDYQKGLLAELSYIDLNLTGKVALYDGNGIRFSELHKYMLWPTESACRGLINGKQFEDISKQIIGPVLGSDTDICNDVVKAGMQDFILTDFAMDPKTGFCAITFKDNEGNVGISYRGTDFDYANGCLREWINANLGGHLMGDSKQGYQANLYFMANCDPNGNNYLFGHSLGGNLVQQALINHHRIIQEAFSINGTPISPSKLNTQDLINVFNSQKFNCCIIAGDVVGLTKDTTLYKRNIRMIENCNGLTTRFSLAHGLCSASYNADGSFKTIDYDQTINEFKEKCEASTFSFFGKNGWEVLKTIQKAEGWLSGMRAEPPELLKDAVIKRAIIDKKIPISLDVNGNPNRILGLVANAWKWSTKTASTIMRPIDHTIRKTSGLALSSAIECFVCPEKVSDHLAIWAQEIKDFDFGNWVYDIGSKFGISPQRLDGNEIKNRNDFEDWKESIVERMHNLTPEWIQTDIKNCKIIQALLKENQSIKDIDQDQADRYISSVERVMNIDEKTRKTFSRATRQSMKTLESIYRQSQVTRIPKELAGFEEERSI